ncbi:hypothetical protein AQUCO_05400135v1 [Aquilegia coerulea]|uniref:Amidase domain-containing protein n=1 Tax=Aquilegia coerulea TaxID=218851 RepID=A0A2G5CHS1_AQUCA|nr:hypothetical protein AQUCO_05400135v1 [Aquilegia coerulea]
MAEMGRRNSDFGAFIEKFTLLPPPPTSSSQQLPLAGLTFAVKDIFDVKGYVTGFGNPDWARTHSAAVSTAPVVAAVLSAGATCVGKVVMDEMAYSINGENAHFGTPVNLCAPDRIPGGSSSGSAVAVAAELVDFSLGTDTGGSIRVPAAFCGILGCRPSHAVVSTSGVIPMAQSFDTVAQVIKHVNIGNYVSDRVPSLEHFMDRSNVHQEYIPSLVALSSAMRCLQRYEFKTNHGEWVTTVKPNLGPGLSERVWEAVKSTDEHIGISHSVKTELQTALSTLLEEYGILVLPTVPGPPPKLQTQASLLETFRVRAFSLLSIAGVSGFCQVNIPVGTFDDLPVSISLIAKHGADGFLLNVVDILYSTLKEQVEVAEKQSY